MQTETNPEGAMNCAKNLAEWDIDGLIKILESYQSTIKAEEERKQSAEARAMSVLGNCGLAISMILAILALFVGNSDSLISFIEADVALQIMATIFLVLILLSTIALGVSFWWALKTIMPKGIAYYQPSSYKELTECSKKTLIIDMIKTHERCYGVWDETAARAVEQMHNSIKAFVSAIFFLGVAVLLLTIVVLAVI